MWTLLQILGALLVVAGFAFIWWPSALIVAGLAVFAVGFLGEPN